MARIAFPLAVCCWIILWVYWFLAARNQKSRKKQESGPERMRQILPMAASYILLFEPFMGFGPLGWRFVTKRPVCRTRGSSAHRAGSGVRDLGSRAPWRELERRRKHSSGP
jgi:hypothetical protein